MREKRRTSLFKPLPDREKDISRRFAAVRRYNRMSQDALAPRLGLTRAQVANVEAVRVPLKFREGISFCSLFNINLRWLATGKLPQQPFTPISQALLNAISERELFSIVYGRHLAAIVEARLKELKMEANGEEKLIFDFRRLGVSHAESHLENVTSLIQSVAKELDEQKKLQFAFALERLAFSHSPSAKAAVKKIKLTHPATSDKGLHVKPRLPSLLERLNRATQETGKMSALANFLTRATGGKVPLASVSRWLSGKREPGGEITLLLQKWVEEQER